MTTKLEKAASEVASVISDYRIGEAGMPTVDVKHVLTWLEQFDEKSRLEVAANLHYSLAKTYLSKNHVLGFLKNLLTNPKLCGKDPKTFWSSVDLLSVQKNGQSQKELIALFNKLVKEKHGMTVTSKKSETAVYLDDAIFGGGHLRNDLTAWVADAAPKKVTVHIIVFALHSGGEYYAGQEINKVAIKAGKEVTLQWWRILQVENRKAYRDKSDVLWPSKLPDHKETLAYVEKLKKEGYPPVLRNPGNIGPAGFFSSEGARDLLEQELLKAGAEARAQCPHLNEYQRPLGNSVLKTLGFGSMVVTFRNCANNCPLPFWVADPWYPLFPRKTN